MLQWLQTWLPRRLRRPPAIPDGLWQTTLSQHPFLKELDTGERARLRLLTAHFLTEKEFHGAHGLTITDAMAVSIAAQACLPLLHLHTPAGQTMEALDWYGDFVGIVVHPDHAVARREVRDASGVVHRYSEVIAGEAMDRGPVMLSWSAVAQAGHLAEQGSNVVIHEFAHKFDMHGMNPGGAADGAPPLPPGFMGTHSATAARERWRQTMQTAFEQFTEALALAERFGGERPWLDAYAGTHPAEFFAVTCEAYFVNRTRFAQEFPALLVLYDGFFKPASGPRA
ncbi:zinc-dependent peptidase [Hydrogenophaga sp.]|uniref:M90 family metallopeptidase n=1 Tax=Hydrogenophaga sp. TaxID=1904254 RepID=UPI0035628E89